MHTGSPDSKRVHDPKTATRQDIDEVLGVLNSMMTRIDNRFVSSEEGINQVRSRLTNIENQLYAMQKTPT